MTKTASINMRADPKQRDLLTKAAKLQNKSRAEFILEKMPVKKLKIYYLINDTFP